MTMKLTQIKKKSESFSLQPNRPVRIDISATAREAFDLMAEQAIHHLIVMDKNEIVGTLSDRDLFFQLFKSNPSGVIQTTEFPIKNAIRRNAPTIAPDTTIEQALKWMQDGGLSVLISRDGNESVDLVTESDLLRATQVYWEKKHTLKDLVQEGEATLASPLVQKLMSTLSDMGL